MPGETRELTAQYVPDAAVFGGVEASRLRLERRSRYHHAERRAGNARRCCAGWRPMMSAESESEIATAASGRRARAPAPIRARFRNLCCAKFTSSRKPSAKPFAATSNGDVIFPKSLQSIETALSTFKKIIIAASGSSRHAGLAGEIMIEDLSGESVDVEYSSEYCYRSTHAGADPIVVVITQSGETADTTAAQREALNRGAKTVAISNVANSTISNEASAALLTRAGLEKAIPATKSFTSQLTLLYLFALFLARKRGRMTSEVTRTHLNHLADIPTSIEKSLPTWDVASRRLRQGLPKRESFPLPRPRRSLLHRPRRRAEAQRNFLRASRRPASRRTPPRPQRARGRKSCRSSCSPRAIRTIPTPTCATAKLLQILEFVKKSGGKAIAIATEGDREITTLADRTIYVPAAPELLLPILEVVPLQLFAYHFAILNGHDVDNPRNLVKSVSE